MNRTLFARIAACLAVGVGASPLSCRADEDRGELLYSTHCIECHTAQVHWREKRLAKDWGELKAQVGRWQANNGLGWKDAEIVDVARYLNGLYYHFPQTGEQLGIATPANLAHR